MLDAAIIHTRMNEWWPPWCGWTGDSTNTHQAWWCWKVAALVLELRCVNVNLWRMMKYSHVADVCMHAFSREKDVCYTKREKMCCWGGENCPLLPGGSRTITHPDTLTHSHSVQKRKHIQGDTNSPGTWLLTFLRCSEVNSLSHLNKPLQLAVVNPQLKNRIYGSIASFSHTDAVGGGRERERWRFLLQLQ